MAKSKRAAPVKKSRRIGHGAYAIHFRDDSGRTVGTGVYGSRDAAQRGARHFMLTGEARDSYGLVYRINPHQARRIAIGKSRPRKNPVKITKNGRPTPFRVYTRSRERPKWSFTAKTYSLGKAISVAMRMRTKGYGIRITGPRELLRLIK